VAVIVPDFAVIVAVRFAWFAKPKPEEKVAVALPVLSVLSVEELSWPLVELKVIVAPDTVALLASTAVTVIVVEFELSEKIVVGVPDICMLTTGAVVVVGVGVVVVVLAVLSLQPARTAIAVANKNGAENLVIC
jgi:hypothetical protein